MDSTAKVNKPSPRATDSQWSTEPPTQPGCYWFREKNKGVRNHFQPACADLQAGSMGEIKGDILPFSAAASPLALISRRGVG